MPNEALLQKSCIPCRGGTPPMGKDEAETLLKQAEGWNLTRDARALSREWTMKNFRAAMDFLNAVAELAEAEGHHPDMEIFRWNHVRVALYTHKIGGLHENDFIMAAKINALPKEEKAG